MIWETPYLLEITSGLALVFAVPHALGSADVPGCGVGGGTAALRGRSPWGDWRATPREGFSPGRPQDAERGK